MLTVVSFYKIEIRLLQDWNIFYFRFVEPW
jgi:hypothetical protein